jgi:hypothetical protein
VESSKDGPIHEDFIPAIIDIMDKFAKFWVYPWPAGMRPVHFSYLKNGPVTYCSNSEYYVIGLNSPTWCYDQLAYQLGHELCHIWCDPRRTNWFVESCCEMMSQVLLNQLSESWVDETHFCNWNKQDGEHFKLYAMDTALKFRQEALGSDRSPTSTELISIKNALQLNPKDRSKGGIIAEALKPILMKKSDNLQALAFLGLASDLPPVSLTEQDSEFKIAFRFRNWEEAVPDNLKGLVKEIACKLGDSY